MQILATPAVPPHTKFATFLNSKWCMVLLALAIRLAVVGVLYPEQMAPGRNHFLFGFENGRIASSVVQGHGFGSPLFEEWPEQNAALRVRAQDQP